jgi:hypothetical protein
MEFSDMKNAIIETWDSVMDNRHNPLRHLDLASQHYLMQVLGWMWSMLFSLSFLSIFQFGYIWLFHVFMVAGVAMTVAVFRQAEKKQAALDTAGESLSAASRCVWKLDSEA